MQKSDVVLAFDSMENEYDDLVDLWYSWLFARLNTSIVHFFEKWQSSTNETGAVRVLDIGCGTGLQALLYRDFGFHVTAFDLSPKLIRVAVAKEQAGVRCGDELSRAPLRSVRRLKNALQRRIDDRWGTTEKHPVVWSVDDAITYSYPDCQFDVINCCGSTLNFISEYKVVLEGIAKALKPGGVLVLEIENRLNLDLVWPIIDRLIGGPLKYDQSFDVAWHNICGPGHRKIDYPFELQDGTTISLDLHLFDHRLLRSELKRFGLRIVSRQSVHMATNLIPSTVLQRPRPKWLLRTVFSLLGRFDQLLDEWFPFYNFGCSQIIFAIMEDRPRAFQLNILDERRVLDTKSK